MIVVIEVTERKPYKGEKPKTSIMKFYVTGYSDVQQTLKAIRKITKSKLKLLEIRES